MAERLSEARIKRLDAWMYQQTGNELHPLVLDSIERWHESEAAALTAERDEARQQTEDRTAELDRYRDERESARVAHRMASDGRLAAEAALASLQRACEQLKAEKHGAYSERNQLVAVLSKLWPSHWADHPADDLTWDDEWRTIICIHSPVGQLTWHVKEDERWRFAHLSREAAHWDGHTTEEKYARLTSLLTAPPVPSETAEETR